MLDTKGKGHYVGTVLAVRTRSPAWFGEGDEKIYIDGEAKASIWGTGTEDYFLCAWGLKQTSTPYFGVPYFDQWGIVGGHTSAYRWHLNDPIVFNTGIKVTFEHFGWMSPDENPEHKTTSWNEREDDYASVAFWYQTGEPTFTARAPHARERKLPSLERVTAYARDFADAPAPRRRRGHAPAARLLRRPATALHARSRPRARGSRSPSRSKKKEPLRLLLNLTKSYDFGQYQAFLNGVKLGGSRWTSTPPRSSTRSFTCWTSGPSRAPTRCGWNASARTTQSAGYYFGLESVSAARAPSARLTIRL